MDNQASKPLALVIEDDPDAALIFFEALQQAGYRVIQATDGRLAEQALQMYTPNLVALDMHLPYVSGRSILSKIRSDEQLKDTQVMIITADSRLAQELDQSADIVIVKPASFIQIRDLSKRLLNKG